MIFAKKGFKNLYYGWVMVAVSGMIFFFSAPGQTYSISVFIDTMPFDVSQTTVSLFYSAATLLSGISLLWMGRLIDRLGHRKMTLIVASGLGVVLLINSTVGSFLIFGFSFFFLRFFGQGSMTLIPSSLVPQWFEKNKATALSIAQIGGLLATLLIPLVNVWVIGTFGWSQAWRIWAAAIGFIFIPVIFLTLVNKPADLNLLIENKDPQDAKTIRLEDDRIKRQSLSLKDAINVREFWILGFVSMIPSMFTTGMTFHIYTLMRLRGILEPQAALLIGLLAFPALFMPILAKTVIDRFQLKWSISLPLLGIIAAMALLNALTGFTSALIFMIAYGSVIAVLQLSLNVSWPYYFGRYHLGSIRGAATVFMVIGSAFGPLPFGISYDLTGEYTSVILGMMVFTALTWLFTLTLRKTRMHAR